MRKLLLGDYNGLFGDCLGHRRDPQCFARGHMAFLQPFLFQIRAKPCNNGADKIVWWKFSEMVLLRDYIAN